jgi:hypothetical protein
MKYGVSWMHKYSRIVGGWCVYYQQHGMLILPELMKGRRIECKEKSNELGGVISKLRLGVDEMSIESTFKSKGKRLLS